MKPWVHLTVVTIAATTAVAWADVDFSAFGFRPEASSRKQLKRSYAAELLQKEITTPVPLMADIRPTQKPARIRVAHLLTSDAEPLVKVVTPLELPKLPDLSGQRPRSPEKALVEVRTVQVEHHDLEPGLKLLECDREIDRQYPSLPPVLECVTQDDGTAYVAKSRRTARDGAYLWNYKVVTWGN